MKNLSIEDKNQENLVENPEANENNKLTEEEEKKEANEFEGTSAKPGSLMFEFTQQAKPKWAQTGNAIRPTTGDMFIFPALLQHWVVPFKSKCTRISVSGNIEIINRQNLPNDFF